MPSPQNGLSSGSDDEDSSENRLTKYDYMMQLRKKEVLAYHYVCGVFRAQGHLTPDKLRLLREIAGALYIPEDRHRAECRIAVNDSELTAIANCVAGPSTEAEWIKEGTDLRPSPPSPHPLNTHVLKACDKVANAVREAFRNKKPGQKTVTAFVHLRHNWSVEGGSSEEEEEITTDKNKNGPLKEQIDENKDDEVSSLSEEPSEDSAEEDQNDEDIKNVRDKVLMPPPPVIPASSSSVTTLPHITDNHVSAPPTSFHLMNTAPSSSSVTSVPLPVPLITVPSPTSITVIPATSSLAEPIPTSVQNPYSVSETHSTSEVTLIDSQLSGIQETPILSENDDIQFLSLPDTLDSTLPPLVVVPPAEPVISVPQSSSFSPPIPTSSTLVLPSGMSFQMREANGDIMKRKRTMSQDSGSNIGPSAKTVAFSNISKMTPVMVSASGNSSQGQIKMTPMISRAKMAATSTYSTSLSNSTQKVIIVSNATSLNGSGLQRSMSVPVGPIIRTSSQPQKQSISGVLQPSITTNSGMVTKFRPKMVSVPARCRAKTNQLVIPNLQLKNTITLKQDNVAVVDTNLKRMPASSCPTRILPKPQGSGQMFIVSSGQGTKVTTSVGGQTRMVNPRVVEGVSPTTLRPVGSKQNVVILQKGGGQQRALTLTNTSKEMMQKLMSKKCVVIQSSKVVPKNITPKPSPPVTTSPSNVVVLDLSQEQYRHNLSSTTIADILQASGIITSSAAQTIVTSAPPQNSQPSGVTANIEPNWVSLDKSVDLDEVTLPIDQSESVLTLDEAVGILGEQSESTAVVADLIAQDNMDTQTIQISDEDCPDQIFTVTPEELAASEMGFLSEKSVVVTEPLTGQIVIDTLSAEMGASHSFLPHRVGAVTIQHSNIDMPTNMSLEEYSSQQMENQGLN